MEKIYESLEKLQSLAESVLSEVETKIDDIECSLRDDDDDNCSRLDNLRFIANDIEDFLIDIDRALCS